MTHAVTIDRPADPWRSLFGAEPRFAALGLLFLLSLAVTLPALALDPREVQGAPVWAKPVKFQLALALYMLTLAAYARWLPPGMTARPAYRAFSVAVVLAVLAEMAWIGGAAAQGISSHFNVATPAMAALYPLMGALAMLLTSASAVFGVAIWRNPDTGLPPALRLSVAMGLVLTLALTVPVAGTLSGMGGHFVGQPATGAAVPLMGWSLEVGDLRVAHFLATHPLHVLPLAGLAAVRLLPAGSAVAAVWIAAAVYVSATAAVFFRALSGLPFLPAI